MGLGEVLFFTTTMDHISRIFEVVGVAVLAFGFVWAVVQALRTLAGTRDGSASYLVLRSIFGWSILMSLEILVAADLIRTVAVQPSIGNVAVLGLIVLIRTFLSFSLDVEIEGMLPWKRHELGGLDSPRSRKTPAPSGQG